MKNRKLRTKITIRVGILLILGGVILNIVVKNIIDYSSNNTIKNDMTMQQNNSTDFINEYFMINGKSLDKQTFISNSPKISMSLSENSNSTVGIYAELLQTNFHNDKFRKQAINSIEEESAKLNSMISSILEVSRGQILSREKTEFNIGKMLNLNSASNFEKLKITCCLLFYKFF